MKRTFLLVLTVVVFVVLIYWLKDSTTQFGARQGESHSSSATGSGSMSESSSQAPEVAVNGGPFVVRHEPENGTRDVPLSGKVVIVFSVPMDRTSVQSALEADFPYFLRWTDDTELQLYPVGLETAERYRYSLGTGATDNNGKPIAHKLSVLFTTGASVASPSSKDTASSSSFYKSVAASSIVSSVASFSQTSVRSSARSSVAAFADPRPVAPAVSQPPVVQGISVIVLHEDEEEIRVRATVRAFDPEGEALTIRWSVNCGSMVGGKSGGEVEWRAPFYTCPQAVFTVEVRDPVGATTVYAEPAF